MAEQESKAEEEGSTELPEMDPSNYSIDQLEDEIYGVNDSEWLEELIRKEKEGDNRVGAKKAIQEQYTHSQSGVTSTNGESDEQNDEQTEEEEQEMSETQTETEEGVVEVDPIDLSISDTNERAGKAEASQELIESVQKRGIDSRERPLVRPDGEGGYEVVAGQRRVDAAVEAGLDSIEADNRDMDDLESRLESTRENFGSSLRQDVSVADRALALQNIWQEMGEDGFPSSGQLSEQIGASTQTVSKWIEPLREDWEGTVVDPRTDDNGLDLDQIGEAALQLIRNTSGIQKHQRLELAGRVEGGDETQSSITEMKNAVESEEEIDEYIQTGELPSGELEVDEPAEPQEDSESDSETDEEGGEGDESSTDETDSESTQSDTEETDVELEEETNGTVTIEMTDTYLDPVEQAAEERDMETGRLIDEYVYQGLVDDGFDV